VTPSAWGSAGAKGLQVGTALALGYTNATGSFIAGNAYYSSTGWQRVTTGAATAYLLGGDGAHIWYSTSTSSTANSAISFTQAMTLDASGNLGVGTTSPANYTNYKTLTLNGSSGGAIELQNNGTTTALIFCDSQLLTIRGATSTPIVFQTNGATERARITSGGDLLVGTTSQIGTEKFGVDSGSSPCGKFKGGNASNVTIDAWNPATSGDNIFVAFRTETAETSRGTITYNRVGGLVAYNTTSDYRAKDILGSVTNSGAIIDALKVYEGKMKGATQSRPMLVAHEAQEVAPYAVTGEKDAVDDDGNPKYQQIDVSSFVPLLIAEIQSLRARVKALEAK
jgi:hypothetical protein